MTVRRPPVLANFGGASPRWQLLRRPSALVASVKSGALVSVERAAWWHESAAALRARVRDAAERYVAPASPRAAAIVTAILIGDRAGLDDDVERRLQQAGTYHVIAISGGNVAVLTAISLGLFRLLCRSARVSSAATLAIVAAYGWVVGGDPSVARAVAAACVYLGAGAMGVTPAPLAVLRTAAIVLVLWRPTTVIEAGAWLSFGATAAIVALVPRWNPAISALVRPGAWGFVARVLLTGVAVTVAAELCVLPISAAVFSQVTLAGVMFNLVAVPAMSLVQVCGFLMVFVAAWPAAAGLFAGMARLSADVLVESAGLLDTVPWLASLSWRVPPVSGVWTAIYFGALVVAMTAAGRARLAATGVSAVALLVILTAPFTSVTQPSADRVRVTVMDVGQGDAILVQRGGGFALLVDTGGAPGSFDVGGRIVTPAAWAVGQRRVAMLALTHGDRDHAGGALAVLRDLRPREVWEGVPVARDQDRAQLKALAASQGAVWRTIQAGGRMEWRDLVIEAWHPPAPDWERQKVRNDDSLVLRLRFGELDVWLTGDAGPEFEARFRRPDDAGRLRVLKVAHHGSRTSTGPAFVEALRPQIAIVSAGQGNLFGHPSPDVIARLTAVGASIFRTDRDGAVVIESDGVTARVQAARGRTWTVSVPSSPP
jgi:competence protein ComEC